MSARYAGVISRLILIETLIQTRSLPEVLGRTLVQFCTLAVLECQSRWFGKFG
jgi:hypothetical protein